MNKTAPRPRFRASIKLCNGDGVHSRVVLVRSNLDTLAVQVHVVIRSYYLDNPDVPRMTTLNKCQIVPDSDGYVSTDVIKEVILGTRKRNP